MGDSHHGFRVVATDDNFYEHYQYRGTNHIELAEGQRAEGIFDAVLGSEVAKRLHYGLGQKIVLSHGLEGSFTQHANRPFTVVGILKPTATPVDRALYITLYGDEAMHYGWENGAPSIEALNTPASAITKDMLHIKTISAFLVGTKLRIQALPLMWEINRYKPEPLTAVIPALALEDLWSVIGYADVALSLVSGAVLVVGLLAMLTALYTALNERRREVAVLRAVGLHARQIFTLFVLESAVISTLGMVIGLGAVYVILFFVRGPVENHFGIPLAVVGISQRVAIYMASVVVAGTLLGCIPAIRAYRNSLVDGLTAS
jgi:putative ABC transport system permease protein